MMTLLQYVLKPPTRSVLCLEKSYNIVEFKWVLSIYLYNIFNVDLKSNLCRNSVNGITDIVAIDIVNCLQIM